MSFNPHPDAPQPDPSAVARDASRDVAEELFRRAVDTNPVVHAAMMMHHAGDLTLEEALKVAVVQLVAVNENLSKMRLESLLWPKPAPSGRKP